MKVLKTLLISVKTFPYLTVDTTLFITSHDLCLPVLDGGVFVQSILAVFTFDLGPKKPVNVSSSLAHIVFWGKVVSLKLDGFKQLLIEFTSRFVVRIFLGCLLQTGTC